MRGCNVHRLGKLLILTTVSLAPGLSVDSYAADTAATDKKSISSLSDDSIQTYRYVLNLESTFTKDNNIWLPEISILKKYALYTIQYPHNGKIWYRARLGFFASHAETNRILKILKPYYPGIWVDRINANEFSKVKNWKEKNFNHATAENKAEQPDAKIVKNTTPALPTKVVIEKVRLSGRQLMDLAKRALAEKHYREAAQYYIQILSRSDDAFKQDAQELLGVSREKNGQLDSAKKEYEKYLKKYPRGEGADRVRQRLFALITARNEPNKIMPAEPKEDAEWTSFGSFSQFLRRDVSEAAGVSVENTALQSDMVLSARRRSRKYDFKTFMSGYNLYNIDDSNRDNKSRLNSLYAELIERQGAYSAKVGRFTENSDGVLGRMDGMLGRYAVTDRWKLNAVVGYPVELTTSNIADKTKPFYSIGFYAGTFAKSWDYNFYYFNRNVESLTDRQALGGEIRYLGSTKTAFAFIDYDTYFNKLNTLFIVSNWRFAHNSIVNMTLNYRLSPMLMMSNALQGQGTQSIDTLRQTHSIEEIKQLALDRTAVYKALTFSGSRQLNEKYSLNGDVTISNLSGTPSSGGVDATPPTGNEYFYGVQLVGVNLYSQSDTSIGELRYESTSAYLKYKVSANTRRRLKNKWSYRPGLSYEIRHNTDGSDVTKITPSLRVDYQYTKKAKFEFEAQYEDVTLQSSINSKESNYSISLGYIYDFY